ncbi:MAG TPA: S8 family serine peptidase, partial [Verrucomicrobiae bacterium]|nr:S8 family serine peptidase [Verrucomicrobiae bacterium]
TDSLSWNVEKGRVTADVQTWDLVTLLENVATATGWDIYVEPKTRLQASVKFKERPPGEALKMLLGNLSYALLPQTNGPSKLYVFRNNRNDATQLVRGRKKSSKLDKELIVTMKPGGSLDTNALGAKITGKIDKFNAYRLEFKDAAAAEEARKKLEQDGNVDVVDSNYDILRPPDGEALSVSSVPGLDLKIKPNESGGGPIIGLIDTAIQKQPGREGFYLPPLSVSGDATIPGDVPTHGTAMAQAILTAMGLVKDGGDVSGIRIQPVDIYGDAPSSSTFQLVQGILKALEQGANPINLSLGSEAGNELLHRVISEASKQGILFFAAAGNQPTTAPTFPAAYPEVTAVTAVDRGGRIAPYANYGSFVDVGAPGSIIVPFNDQSFVVMGTSPATAWASGVAGSLLASGVPASSIPGKLESIMAVPPVPQK